MIVEEVLDCKKQPIETDTLIDYKIWCFDGNIIIYGHVSTDIKGLLRWLPMTWIGNDTMSVAFLLHIINKPNQICQNLCH